MFFSFGNRTCKPNVIDLRKNLRFGYVAVAPGSWYDASLTVDPNEDAADTLFYNRGASNFEIHPDSPLMLETAI